MPPPVTLALTQYVPGELTVIEGASIFKFTPSLVQTKSKLAAFKPVLITLV